MTAMRTRLQVAMARPALAGRFLIRLIPQAGSLSPLAEIR
jgi:hypothetical protein